MSHRLILSVFSTSLLFGCSSEKNNNQETGTSDDSGLNSSVEYVNPDFNGDGSVNILVLGTTSAINGVSGFSPEQVSSELQNILAGDSAITGEVTVVSEDMYTSKSVTIGLGGSGTEYTYTHHSHSLTQYYYWPENIESRIENLKGEGATDWDYVVIGADPHIISTMPGYYALGVEKIAAKVVEGDAQPLLLMVWPEDASEASISLLEGFLYRTANGSSFNLPVVPAGLAWASLTGAEAEPSETHPTPNGAYLTAASIYSQITQSNADESAYEYNSALASSALDAVNQAEEQTHYDGEFDVVSPFSRCDVSEMDLTYNHTGSSSENGILGGLNWVFDQAEETLANGSEPLITFNYGRANTNFEANKRYQIDPERFLYSFGFPMQDHGNHGDESMLYGLDKRDGGVANDTDLGVARYMIDQSEVPYGRAIPIRTLFAQMKEANPEQSAYRDDWHMHNDLDKAIGAYMYTLLTSKCALSDEPNDVSTAEWNTWNAHKIGCDTAWTLMYLEASDF